MSKPITGKITPKTYRCTQCGYTTTQSTNHWGQTYSLGRYNTCSECPPYKKYPEYGGSTVWECVDECPNTHERAEDWTHTT